MKTETLLAEIRTEELPPAQLWRLADSFADSLLAELQKIGFADNQSHRVNKKLATPRRLVALLHNIKSESPAKEIFRRGPQLVACRDSEGLPTKALSGFMRSVGATCEKDLMETEDNGKTYIAWKGNAPGQKLADHLPTIVERVLLNLPAPRLMRWGDNDFKFIRPIRGILMIHGEQIINGKVMGVVAGNTTKGHPFLSLVDKIIINRADSYEEIMREQGKVIVDMDERCEEIFNQRKELQQEELPEGASIDDSSEKTTFHNTARAFSLPYYGKLNEPLIRETAAMSEYPKVYIGEIKKEFLALPSPCIKMCMQTHQRFFPVLKESGGELLPNYFMVSDNQSTCNNNDMVRGYNSVLRARLSDVQFYYEQDQKIPLNDYVEKLKSIVFHQKLGTQHDRIGRICKIATAAKLSANLNFTETEIEYTAKQILAPLSTLMVNEYPDLREQMANIYFKPKGPFYFIYLCYHLETITSMFGVGEKPTGSKDPHGLRRCANFLVDALSNDNSKFSKIKSIRGLIRAAINSFDGKIAEVDDEIYHFILERAKFITPASVSTPIKNSVFSKTPDSFVHLDKQMIAMHDFVQKRESQTLAAANKRINNIFRKSEINADDLPSSDYSLFTENVEHILHKTIGELKMQTAAYIDKQDYAAALKSLAEVAAPVDDFFAKVMVNAEDKTVRQNRFALLKELRALLNCVADISKLT